MNTFLAFLISNLALVYSTVLLLKWKKQASLTTQITVRKLGDYLMVSTHEIVYFFSVHVKVDEKITLIGGKDGGLQNMEIRGLVLLRISDSQFGRICLKVENDDKKGFQFQVIKEVFFFKQGIANFLLFCQ